MARLGGTNKQTNKRTNKRKFPCVVQDFVPFGAAAQKRRKRRVVNQRKPKTRRREKKREREKRVIPLYSLLAGWLVDWSDCLVCTNPIKYCEYVVFLHVETPYHVLTKSIINGKSYAGLSLCW